MPNHTTPAQPGNREGPDRWQIVEGCSLSPGRTGDSNEALERRREAVSADNNWSDKGSDGSPGS